MTPKFESRRCGVPTIQVDPLYISQQELAVQTTVISILHTPTIYVI